MNLDDRNSSVLFGDAAGAAIVAPERPDTGILGVHLASDGEGYGLINIPAGGSRKPFTPALEASDVLMQIENGRARFLEASPLMITASEKALARAGLRPGRHGAFVPHQANSRMMAAVERGRRRQGRHDDLDRRALRQQLGRPTIPFSLSMATEQRLYKPGRPYPDDRGRCWPRWRRRRVRALRARYVARRVT